MTKGSIQSQYIIWVHFVFIPWGCVLSLRTEAAQMELENKFTLCRCSCIKARGSCVLPRIVEIKATKKKEDRPTVLKHCWTFIVYELFGFSLIRMYDLMFYTSIELLRFQVQHLSYVSFVCQIWLLPVVTHEPRQNLVFCRQCIHHFQRLLQPKTQNIIIWLKDNAKPYAWYRGYRQLFRHGMVLDVDCFKIFVSKAQWTGKDKSNMIMWGCEVDDMSVQTKKWISDEIIAFFFLFLLLFCTM